MRLKEKTTFNITKEELISARWIGMDDQVFLSILKSKGAPVIGIIHLEPDTSFYNWTRIEDHTNHVVSFVVEPIDL